MKLGKALLLSLSTLAMGSCSSSEPDEDIVRRAIVDALGGPQSAEIIDFEKTDGSMKQGYTGNYYAYYFKSKVKLLRGGRNSECLDSQYSRTHNFCWGLSPSLIEGPGTIKEINSEIDFEKTEKGWRTPQGNLYN